MDTINTPLQKLLETYQKVPLSLLILFTVLSAIGSVVLVRSSCYNRNCTASCTTKCYRKPKEPFADYTLLSQLYLALFIVAPVPRPPQKSEKSYITIVPDGSVSKPAVQPCWYDDHLALKERARSGEITAKEAYKLDEGEVFMTVVVPAYNEQDRMSGMLEEAVEYLQSAYPPSTTSKAKGVVVNGHSNGNGKLETGADKSQSGWEILLVSDGSTDKTIETALNFAREHQLSLHPPTTSGPWTSTDGPKLRSKSAPKVEAVSTHIPHGSIRVISLTENRGKGGAVTHGMRHARGQYVVFADADGASRFSDLGKLVERCEDVKDGKGRAVGVGSRAHMVGSEAVVKVKNTRTSFSHPFLSSPSLCVCTSENACLTDTILTALSSPQHPHAQFPPPPPAHDTPSDRLNKRHTMRFQALLAARTPLYNPLHAQRGLDFRRRNADAC